MIPVQRLDVVIPTYKREVLLRKTLDSFANATVPQGLQVSIIVVDNNSNDGTAAMVQGMQPTYPLPLRYILETKQGSSQSRNAGINASNADLLGFIDDDEEVESEWFKVIAREFADPAVQFIGGPCEANWVTPKPDWLPKGYHSVISAIPAKPRGPFGPDFPGVLMGGNCVFRRDVFNRIGLYSTQLGRSGKGLLSEEDADLQRRLQDAGVYGLHVPDLVIRHYIFPERLTRSYHRRWVYWRGASQGVRDRTHPDAKLSYLFGIQRYRFGQAIRAIFSAPLLLLRGNKAEAFRSELPIWDLMGFIYGKYFLRVEKMYSQKPTTGKAAS